MADFKPGTLSSHHQEHHAAGSEGFEKTTQPDQRLGFALHFSEKVKNVVGLRADRFPLSCNEISLPHIDGGDPLFGQLFFNQLFAEDGVGAQVAASLQAACQELAGQGTGRRVVDDVTLQLKTGGLTELIHRKGAYQSLAEHAVRGLPDNVVPGEMFFMAALLQPDLFIRTEIDRTDPGC